MSKNVYEFLAEEVKIAVNSENLTLLQALIINFLSDPEEEFSSAIIAEACNKYLGQGSPRHVRKVRKTKSKLIQEIMDLRKAKLNDDYEDTMSNVDMLSEDNGENAMVTVTPPEVNETDDGYWDVTEDLPKCVKTCGKVPSEVFLYLSSVVRTKIRLYMKWAKHQEWLAYLAGKKVSDNAFEIMDIVLPDQNASSTLVSKVVMDNYNELSIVGVIHSHHDMGGAGNPDHAGFSGHDEAFINTNHDISLLVARDGIAGHVRLKTECGAFFRAKAIIKELDDKSVKQKDLKKEFQDKINFGRGRGGSHRGWTFGSRGWEKISASVPASMIGRDNYHF